MCHLRATHITVGYSKVDFLRSVCIFQRCCLVLSMTLKSSHGIRTSCNVPRFAVKGDGRDVRAAPAPVAGYIESAHAIIAAPAPVVEYIAPAPAELRSTCAGGGAFRTSSTPHRLRHWWSRSLPHSNVRQSFRCCQEAQSLRHTNVAVSKRFGLRAR